MCFWMRDTVVAYIVHVASMMLCTCNVVYTLRVYMLFIQCYVHDGIDSVV